jgi:hypothetical protein
MKLFAFGPYNDDYHVSAAALASSNSSCRDDSPGRLGLEGTSRKWNKESYDN